MKIVNSQQMQNIDRFAIDSGIPSIDLMENAATAFCRIFLREIKPDKKCKISIIVGSGNNGGDGLAVARILGSKGFKIWVFLISTDLKGDSLINYKKLKKIEIFNISDRKNFNENKNKISSSDIIIDAILGTGLRSKVTGIKDLIISFINKLEIPVASIDLPSGLQAGEFNVDGNVIKATLTVTFGLPKIPTVLYPAKEFTGKLFIENIGFPDKLLDSVKTKINYTVEKEIPTLLPKRREDSHKGEFGHLLVWAGSEGKTGAAYMTSISALRAGTGLVTTACPENIYPILALKSTEIMTLPLKNNAETAILQLKEIKDKIDTVALGPGLGTEKYLADILNFILTNFDCPVIVDADGLNLLSENLSFVKKSVSKLIFTPHYGEMSRLVKKSVAEIKKDKLKLASSFASLYNCILILKGSDTIIASPHGDIYMNSSGNSGLAKAGSGDVLTGILGGIVTQFERQKLSLLDACRLSVFIHGKAADLAAEKINKRSIIASDVINNISKVFDIYEKK